MRRKYKEKSMTHEGGVGVGRWVETGGGDWIPLLSVLTQRTWSWCACVGWFVDPAPSADWQQWHVL